MNFVEELTWRGMVHQMMPGTPEQLQKEQTTAYVGIDPTADSLHIGHLCSVMILRHFQPAGWTVLLIIVAAVLFFIFARGSVSRVNGLEERFMNNLNEREAHEKKIAPVASMVAEQLAGYDVHIEPVVVSADSEIVGKSLAQVPFRGDSGVNIVKIQRGSRSILIPSGGEVIYPADKLLAVGTTEQIQAFRKSMKDSIRKAKRKKRLSRWKPSP